MRVAISNIAWETSEDPDVADLLNAHAIDAIDVAPAKYFADVHQTHVDEVERVRQWWERRGVTITGMQALLFGTTGLAVFGSDESRTALLSHLHAVCRIAANLGATRLVFGSPRNRDRTGLDDARVGQIATDFFYRLGEIAASQGVMICLEPNPVRYHSTFMLNSSDTALIVRGVEHPAIRMQLDTGALAINGEDVRTVVEQHADIIGHIHASEPDLVTLGDGASDHGAAAVALREYLSHHVVSIEMLPQKNESNLQAVDRALSTAVRFYRAMPL